MKIFSTFFSRGLAVAAGALAFVSTASVITAAIDPLTLDGNHFKNAAGNPVRFWGVNLAAFYPTHAQADAIAANLASREINIVRPHHYLRNSLDWNTLSGIPSLVTYVGNTRTPHAEAWDRFDYFNAQLRARGIYLALSLHATRRFLAGDVDILTTDATDRTNWMNAMTALNSVSNNLDLFKMLPMIDERAARLMEEFAQQLLTHVNPYTGLAYGNDPQVLYLETMNETSSEYTIIAGNKFQNSTYPAISYWSTILQSKWDAYTAAHGIPASDVYTVAIAQRATRSEFLRGLDETYFNRMKTLVRNTGCQTPIAFSNLWRGDTFQKLQDSLNDVAEEHDYDDPLVPRSFNDALSYFARSTPATKPYFIGELNEGQTDALINANAPYRATLQLAASAYGAFNDWTGVTWFAWAHGDKMVGNDGWSIWEERRPAVNSDIIGQIESDGMMLDHLRTAGILFKRGLVAPSTGPLTWVADDPLGGNLNYSDLMAPKYPFKAGWQNIHAIKRAFGPVPPSQPTASWMTTDPTNPLISDTNEIRKDTTRQQLTVSAPQAEAFSGKLDASAPAGLPHLGIAATSGSATVILVSDDGLPLNASENLVISRTQLDAANAEVAAPVTTLTQLKAPAENFAWHIKRTRPRGETGYEALTMANGVLTLPSDGWHEAELRYAAIGSLPLRQSLAQVGDVLRPIFDDAYRIAGVLGTSQGGFTVNAQQVIDPSTVLAPAEGTKSVRMKLTGGLDPCVVGINFVNSISQATLLDFTDYKATAGLRFWIYTKRNVPSFSIELACDNGGQLVELRLPLSQYLQPADYGNKWVQVTVPFADFPAMGIHYDSATGQSTPMAFLWSRVKGVGFYCSTVTSGYYDPYFDDLRVIRATTPSPAIASATSASGTYGVPFSYTITGTNSPTSFTAAGLPAGLVLDAATGVISGTPAAAGNFSMTIGALNGGGTGTASLALTIAKATAAVALDTLSQTYDGAPKAATATTNPAGLAFQFTYDGNATAPTNAGSYTVVATIDNINYSGSASGTLLIAKAAATIALTDLAQVYDGTPKSATTTTTPTNLAVALAYDGGAALPTNAGSYAVAATITDSNYTGVATDTLTISPALASITLSNLNQIYDGAPKPITALTTPMALPVVITYNGAATPPTNAGSYAVITSVSNPNYTGAASGTFVIDKATVAPVLGNLSQPYDGTPKSASVTTTPSDLTIDFTYDGNAIAPTLPGPHAVVATINDANHTGSISGTLVITITALVRHAPAINGGLDGSVQILTGENISLNSSTWISGDLLVPGTPTVLLNGSPHYAGLHDSGGLAAPSGYSVTLNSGALLRYLAQHTNPIALPLVALPPAPTGTRSVTLKSASQSVGDFATLSNLTLNSNVGAVAVPPSNYGTFTANSGSGFIFGISGASTPAIYNLQGLVLNNSSTLQVVGPVVLTLPSGMTLNGTMGNEAHPEWLTLRFASGGLTLNSGVTLHGVIAAPNGTVVVNGNSTLRGRVSSDALTINSQGLLDESGF